MEDYLIELLEQYSRVIIPDFGAIIVKQKKPKKLIFNEFLQYNDGALIDKIAKSDSLSRDESAQKVANYVNELKATLKQGNSIVLENIGVLSMGSSGRINLEEQDTSVVEGSKPTETESPKVQEQTLEVETEEADKAVAEEKQAAKEIAKETPPPPTSVETPKKVTKSETPQKTEEKREAMPVEKYIQQSGNNKANYIIWGILIVLVNGVLIWYFFFHEDTKIFRGKPNEVEVLQDLNQTIPETEEAETATLDSSNEADALIPATEEIVTIQAKEEVVQPKETVKQQVAIKGEKHYVVAGVFRDESNADNLVKDLTDKGFNSEKFGKIGSLHAVSYGVFPSKSEADQFLYKIKKETDPNAWVKSIK